MTINPQHTTQNDVYQSIQDAYLRWHDGHRPLSGFIRELEEAFKDAGYVKHSAEVKELINKRLYANNRMTGQEWCDKFLSLLPKAEYIGLRHGADNDLTYERIGYRKGLRDAKKAAKKAAGLEEEQ